MKRVHPLGEYEARLNMPPEIRFSAHDPHGPVRHPNLWFELKTDKGTINLIVPIDETRKDFIESNQIASLRIDLAKIRIEVHHVMRNGAIHSYPRPIGNFYE